MGIIFTKYKKEDGKIKLLLIYLILNNYDINKIERVEESVQLQQFNKKITKLYGITDEYIDVDKIEQELAEIKPPTLYSPQSYEMYSNEKKIYVYSAKDKNRDLYINDLGILSNIMVITKDCIVSSNRASNIEEANSKGFMYFVNYIINGEFNVGNWKVEYKDNNFKIYYTSTKDNDEKVTELLYHGENLEKQETYRLVLYIIKKTEDLDTEFQADNYEIETWDLK